MKYNREEALRTFLREPGMGLPPGMKACDNCLDFFDHEPVWRGEPDAPNSLSFCSDDCLKLMNVRTYEEFY